MEVMSVKLELRKGTHQWNEMCEIVHVNTGNAKATARIYIRLDQSYQGEALISVWSNGAWQEAYTLLNPQGKYGYKESTAALFKVDRDELLRVLEQIL